MDLVIITASPRRNSNSALITGAFVEGAALAGTRSEYHCLSDRNCWGEALSAVCRAEYILFVLPLFAECIPGTLMEFLEQLQPRLRRESPMVTRKMSFILHSGFPEACQRRCCEQYLKKLPAMLDSCFAGILSRGDSFFLSNVEPEQAVGLLDAYRDMGRQFVEHGGNFLFSEAEAFTGAEYMTSRDARYYNRLAEIFLVQQAKRQGCSVPLDAAPYVL